MPTVDDRAVDFALVAIANLVNLLVTAVQAPNPSDTPTPRPDMRQLAATLEQALRRLRPEYRRCVKLRYVEGRSYDDIAEILHLPVGTVGTYLHRARKELKRILGPLPDVSPSDPAHTPA